MQRLAYSCLIVALISFPAAAWGAGGTSQVARKGHKVSPSSEWPQGMEAFLNLPARTDGWNGWFTEWPNDVDHYQFEVANTAEANAVLATFAEIKADKLYVRLSPGKEPSSIGWVSRIKDGNKTAMLFSCGDQQRLDEWYARLKDGKFGVMEFAKAPTAVPPTITIYVENDAIDLKRLVIPASFHVEAGSTPGMFHDANTKVDPTKPTLPQAKPAELGDELKRVMTRINDYLAQRRKVS